jgi:DNA-binding transcriptional LysR family regulator
MGRRTKESLGRDDELPGFSQLRQFVDAVAFLEARAKEGAAANLKQVAGAIGVGVSTLSGTIKDLQARYERNLFRIGRETVVTPEGRALYSWVSPLVNRYRMMDRWPIQERAKLVVATQPELARALLPEAVGRFFEAVAADTVDGELGGVEIDLRETGPDGLVAAIVAGDAELAIGEYRPRRATAECEALILRDHVPYAVVVNARHPRLGLPQFGLPADHEIVADASGGLNILPGGPCWMDLAEIGQDPYCVLRSDLDGALSDLWRVDPGLRSHRIVVDSVEAALGLLHTIPGLVGIVPDHRWVPMTGFERIGEAVAGFERIGGDYLIRYRLRAPHLKGTPIVLWRHRRQALSRHGSAFCDAILSLAREHDDHLATLG